MKNFSYFKSFFFSIFETFQNLKNVFQININKILPTSASNYVEYIFFKAITIIPMWRCIGHEIDTYGLLER